MNDVAGQAGLNDERSRDLDQATHVRLSRARHQMLGDHADGVLDKVEVERFLVMETTKAFDRAVADARAGDFTWEQITQRVPGLARTYGPQAADRLFERSPWWVPVWPSAMSGGGAVNVRASYATMARTAATPETTSLATGGTVSARPMGSPLMTLVWKPMISQQLASCGPSRTTSASWSLGLNGPSRNARDWGCDARHLRRGAVIQPQQRQTG